MLPVITKIYNKSDFTVQLPLAYNYDGQEFRFTIYTCGEVENGWTAYYIDGQYNNCTVEDDIVTVYVNNNNKMNAGCVTVQSEYDYSNHHFVDNEDNVKDNYKTNIYLVNYETNAFSAQFRPSNLPDLTGSEDFVTYSYLSSTLEGYVTDEELQSQLEDFVTEEDFAAELSNYITDEELTDMGFLTQSDIDNMDLVTKSYLSDKLSTKQNILVSGVNIKTINGYSLLGSGDLVIEGGGGAIDLSSYVTYDFLSSQSYVTTTSLQSALEPYVTQTQLSANSYVTESQLQQAGYVTSSDISDFVTEQDVQNILVEGSYITSNELSQMSYINTQYLDEASYTTLQEVSQQGFTTANDFKTINGYSIVGSGNIEITSGGTVDLSAYVTKSQLQTELSAYVTKDELNAAGYVTESQLQQAGYITSIPSEYVTESELNSMSYVSYSELSSMGYVTQSQLSANSYITINDVPVVDLSSYVTHDELQLQLSTAAYVTQSQLQTELSAYVTTSDLNTELGDYPTNNDLALTLQDYVSYSQFNTYTSDFVVDSDLENFVTYDYLEGQGYITYIPNNYATYDAISQMGYITINDVPTVDLSSYVTKTELSNAGYLTSIPSEYITESELSSMGYITSSALPTMSDYVSKTELSQAGYLTSIPSEYVTQSQLSANSYITESELSSMGYVTNTSLQSQLQQAGYLTSIPNEYVTESEITAMSYVTETELSTMGYITSSDIPTIPVIDESIIPNTTATYTLGDTTHLYDATYANNVYIGTNFIKDITNNSLAIYRNNTCVTKITAGSWPGMVPGGTTRYLGSSTAQWLGTYSTYFYENGTNISDIYTQAYVLTQSQYDSLSQSDKDKETIYIISDQQAYMNNELVTETSLDSRGFLTAANFNYDPVTQTLVLNL